MLTEDDFHMPDDITALRMENELLVLENDLLRSSGSSSEIQRAVDRARREEREKGREAVTRVREKYEADKAERRARYASVPHDELARLKRAESDLRWLVGRLDGSPVGPVLRRWAGWRALAQRYQP